MAGENETQRSDRMELPKDSDDEVDAVPFRQFRYSVCSVFKNFFIVCLGLRRKIKNVICNRSKYRDYGDKESLPISISFL
jgi:hypothetical protein